MYYYYYIPEPPYFLFVASLLAGIAAGAAFDKTLRQLVQEWSKNRSTKTLRNLQGTQLLTPFLGISGGIAVFLASGLQVFGIPGKFAYFVSVALTVLVARLVWLQLGRVLSELERGGSEALDLDSMR